MNGVGAKVVLGRGRLLLASRFVEQGVLGLGSLLLAACLGPERFAPVSLLFVVYTLSLTAAGLGLATAVLRHPPDRLISARTRRGARTVDFTAASAMVALGSVVDGDAGSVLMASGAMWVLGAEASIAKAAAIKRGRAKAVAAAEIATSFGLAFVVVGACIADSRAIMIVAVGLAGKLFAEAVVLGFGASAFSGAGDTPGHWPVFGAMVLAYAISNIDYAVVARGFDAAVLGVYLLAYRLANAVPAQIGNVATRLALVDLATADRAQQTYERYVHRLFRVGVLGALLTIVTAPLVPILVGKEWTPVVGVMMTLAIVVPWRLVLAVAGALAISRGGTNQLLKWEALRLVLVGSLFLGASQASLAALVSAVAMAEVVSCVAYHSLASRATGLVRPARMMVPALGSLVLVGLAGTTIGP